MTIESCADVISLYNGKLVLVNRLKIPKGLAIPGGRLEVNESLEDCALREFREETGLNLKIHKQLGTYSNPSRDPRGQKVSTTFIGEAFGKIKNEKDKTKVILLKLEEIEKNKKFFVFDHYQIIQDFLKSEGIVLLKEDKKAKTAFYDSMNFFNNSIASLIGITLVEGFDKGYYEKYHVKLDDFIIKKEIREFMNIKSKVIIYD